jgi:UDP-N-acetylglucosamine diphosphorylase/glucosamine-1-phosphate N-acetyltransferase
MHVVIFEGIRWDTFAPLALNKPTFVLPCGMGTLLDKQLDLLKPDRLTLWVRPQLAEYCRQLVAPNLKIPTSVNTPLDDQPTLLATGRTLHLARFEMPEEPSAVVEEGELLRFARVEKMAGLGPDDVFRRSDKWMKIFQLPRTAPQARFVDRIWDLIAWNEEALITDFVRWHDASTLPADGPWHVINPDDVRFSKGAKLAPGCVLDASKGPIVLDVGASIGANAVLEGPCYIGQYTQVAPLTTISAGTTICSICKIGGEIRNSIISSYSNMPHHGFVGNSFVGSWVNLGAGTMTSDIKNTYGEVTMQIGDTEHKTGRRRLGAMIGDHSKIAVGSRLNTGSYIGYCCQLSGSRLTPKFVPSYSFWTDEGMQKYDIEKAIEVAQRMMDRRDRKWTELDEQVMRYVADAAPGVEK